MLQNLLGQLGGIEAPFGIGDIINTNEQPVTVALDNNYTYLGPELVQGDVYRTLMTAGRTDTFPTAEQLMNALRGNINLVTPPNNELYGLQPNRIVNLAWPGNVMPFQPGSSFRRIITATTAFALTMAVAANSGVSLGAAPYDQTVVAASSWREFVFQILNSTPAITLTVSQVNATRALSIGNASTFDLINNITPGMSAYGTNVAANSKVAAVNRDTGVITLDTNVTATLGNNAILFTPTVVVYGLRSGPR
jgi:3D (Asp-Asp-Asp) domain-containing protein